MSAIVVYSPTDPTVANRVITYLPSADTNDYIGAPNTLINPDLSAVSGLSSIFWLVSGGTTVVAMSSGQQSAISAALAVATTTLTPPSIGSNQNNYSPTGLSAAQVLRVSSSTAINMTGIDASQFIDGETLYVVNVGSSNITLTNLDSNSASSNQFSFRGAASVVLTPNKAILLQYDATALRWRAIGTDDPYGSTTNTSTQGNDTRLILAVSTPNVISDALAQPPSITGTVSVTNGSATVTGTGTSFTTTLAVGMIVRIGNQAGTNYTISAIASTTSLTLTATFSGTTNASTTLLGIRENDAYIVSTSPAGDWASFAKGDLVVWTGSAWTKLVTGTGAAPANGLIVLVTAFQGTAAGSFASQSGKIATFTGGAWSFTTPASGQTITVSGSGDPLEGAIGVYKASTAAWAISSETPRIVTLTGTNTTTSTSDAVTGLGLQFVPAAGTYEVEFTGSTSNSSTGTVQTTAYTNVGGAGGTATAITSTLRQGGGVATARSGFCGPATGVVVNGVTNIEGRWKVSANTGTRYEAAIKIRRTA
jgi:hypothetical protein